MWTPIIKDTSLENSIKEKLEEISESLKTLTNNDCTLLGGQPGMILFKSYYSKYSPTTTNDSEGNIQNLYEYFAKPLSLNYSYGLAGILLTLQHIEQEEFFDFEDDIKLFDYSLFDTYILKEDTLDYLHGSSGVVLSLIEQKINNKYNYLFESWLTAINNIKEKEDKKYLKWKTNLLVGHKTYAKGYCFGISHGVPSIIIILIKLYKRNPSVKILDHIKKSIAFLIDNQFEEENDFFFPSTIIDNIKSKGRLAWCYGDLGVAVALYFYGDYFDDKEMAALAIKILKKHSVKHDHEKYGINDADFCHGSIGIAHIYARMYNYTNIETFREASERWYKITLEKATHSGAPGGFKHYNHSNGWATEYGLLEGVSGIGLSLISAISNIRPNWDNIFLLS